MMTAVVIVLMVSSVAQTIHLVTLHRRVRYVERLQHRHGVRSGDGLRLVP